MTTTTTPLTTEWVEQILVTAFDSHYGACWYWVNEDDAVRRIRIHQNPTAAPDAIGAWKSVDVVLAQAQLDGDWGGTCTLDASRTILTLDAGSLAKAVEKVLAEFAHTVTADQVREARRYPDDAPDLDAEAADVIVQVALFGTIVYG